MLCPWLSLDLGRDLAHVRKTVRDCNANSIPVVRVRRRICSMSYKSFGGHVSYNVYSEHSTSAHTHVLGLCTVRGSRSVRLPKLAGDRLESQRGAPASTDLHHPLRRGSNLSLKVKSKHAFVCSLILVPPLTGTPMHRRHEPRKSHSKLR